MFVHGNEPLHEQVTITENGECSGPKDPKETQITAGHVHATLSTKGKHVSYAKEENQVKPVTPSAIKHR